MQSVDGIMEVVEAAAAAAADGHGRGSPAADGQGSPSALLHQSLARLLQVLLGLSRELQGSGSSIGPCIRAALRLQQLMLKEAETQAGARPAAGSRGVGAAMRPQQLQLSEHTTGLITPACISAVALLSSDAAKQVRRSLMLLLPYG